MALKSGIEFNYLEPTQDMINIHDITHNLSKEQRFNNSLQSGWSVLQHVMLVTKLVKIDGGSLKEQYIALHHDDPEAYFRDLPAPLKTHLTEYKRLYRLAAIEVGKKFDVRIHPIHPLVEKWDIHARNIEDLLFSASDSEWNDYTFEDYTEENQDCDGSLDNFIRKIHKLNEYQQKQVFIGLHSDFTQELQQEKLEL